MREKRCHDVKVRFNQGAYDRVEFTYLREITRMMGFHEKWVHLTMSFVSSIMYQVTYGRRKLRPINQGRGIRQGDPLSPYLFILCVEGLSETIRKFELHREIIGVRICKRGLIITHMPFADDSYVYCKENKEEADNMLKLLNTFEYAIGQRVNCGKSSIFFSSNVAVTQKLELCTRPQMQEAGERSTYFGLPTILGRNKTTILGYLKERTDNKV